MKSRVEGITSYVTGRMTGLGLRVDDGVSNLARTMTKMAIGLYPSVDPAAETEILGTEILASLIHVIKDRAQTTDGTVPAELYLVDFSRRILSLESQSKRWTWLQWFGYLKTRLRRLV